MLLFGTYCLILVALSLFGGWLPTIGRFTHVRAQVLMSAVAGFMLGIALVQLLPHSFNILGDARMVGMTMLAGLMVMFFLIRIFDFHHHHFPDRPVEAKRDSEIEDSGNRQSTNGDAADATLTCMHDHDHGEHLSKQSLAWVGLMLGLGLHSLMDGVALAAAYKVGSTVGGTGLAGFVTFLAVALHKPLDAMSISVVMNISHWKKMQQFWVNVVFASLCPVAAVLCYIGFGYFMPGDSQMALGFALAFSAGTFLCISLGDLLPELHFHSHDRVKLTFSLFGGVALAIVLELLFHPGG